MNNIAKMVSKMEANYKWKICVILKKMSQTHFFFLKLFALKLESTWRRLACKKKRLHKNVYKIAAKMAV